MDEEKTAIATVVVKVPSKLTTMHKIMQPMVIIYLPGISPNQMTLIVSWSQQYNMPYKT